MAMGNTRRIIVLNYHRLGDHTNYKSIDQQFSVKSGVFLEQMGLIKGMNIPVVSLDDLINGNFARQFGITLTFDDGHLAHFQIAYHALKHLNFSAAFFPVVNNISKPGCVTWKQLSEIADNNFTIGSHGLSHALLTRLPRTEQQHELEYSKSIIEERIGKPVAHFALPYGCYNRTIVQLAKEVGYKSVMTTIRRLNRPDKKPFVVHRWNIKQNTSLASFGKMLINDPYMSPLNVLAIALKECAETLLRGR
jgi:peptidoglycan/xylan/chitin deacetylase (PgdA/CDA1 family)